jgi:phosphopantothenoylcysteine decarboxylase/phosphopantothenate--cysteine ligase
MVKRRQIVLGVTGSIAAYKSAEIIRRLKEEGFYVSVVMTKEAEEFITPLTLATLSEDKVHRDLFAVADLYSLNHIALSKKADLVLIAPATANIIGKLASGICDNLLTCVVMATGAPILIAPAMNTEMYKNKIVQENIQRLKAKGLGFVGPIKGRLACGDVGEGCLADTGLIISEVKRILKHGAVPK